MVMVRKSIAMLLALALSATVLAQEVLLPLQGGPRKLPRAKSASALELPVFDDFAGRPTNVWQRGGATTSDGTRLLPPTIGVVTLDAIDANGNLYAAASDSPFPADTLESACIRLDRVNAADSVVLSFYYLPGGGHGNQWERTGEMPDAQDSLYLDFYNAADSVWVTVWSHGGTCVDTLLARTGTAWQYVAVGLTDAAYFDSTFRFRFRNHCSLEPATKPGLSGNCDMWHLDYIYLDRDRTTDVVPEFRDVAFVSPAPSMLAAYNAMPARQYRSSDMAQAVDMTIGNLYSSNLASHYSYKVKDAAGSTLHSYDGGYENAPAFLPGGVYQTAEAHARPAVGYAFPEGSAKREYIIEHVVKEGSAADQRPQNDTVRFRQVFADYYAYDDGTAENGYGLTSTASHVYLAYRFDLNVEDTLTAVDMYFNRTVGGENEHVPLRLTVWQNEEGRPGTVLYSDSERRYAEFDGLDCYHRYLLEEPLTVDGSIFVGFEQENNYYVNLGFDRSRNTADRIYYLTGTTWQQSILSGSLMLRPCFGAAATVGVGEAEAPQVRVYPNPASDVLHVQGVGAEVAVELIDALGRRVRSVRGQQTVNTADLPAGLYLLRVAGNGRQAPSIHKIIIKH